MMRAVSFQIRLYVVFASVSEHEQTMIAKFDERRNDRNVKHL